MEAWKSERFDKYAAIYLLCIRWHSGQWSRGYRLLSRLTLAGFRPGLSLQNGKFDSAGQRNYYRAYFKLRNTL